MVTSFICIHTKVCIYSIKETVCNRAKAGSELPESVAPILQNGGSQSPDRWLKEPRNNHCEYITEHRNLFITGATGCGKTYMACAFGMEACKQYFNTRYVRLPDLLIDLELARTDGTYKKVMAKYATPLVLILDEWLLLKPTEAEQRDIFELLHRRRKKSSTIFCSQYERSEWYDQLGGDASPLADAIIDRIAHDSYVINITSIDPEKDRSMREVYGLDKNLRE